MADLLLLVFDNSRAGSMSRFVESIQCSTIFQCIRSSRIGMIYKKKILQTLVSFRCGIIAIVRSVILGHFVQLHNCLRCLFRRYITKQYYHHNGDQAARRPYIVCSISGRQFGDLNILYDCTWHYATVSPP